MPAPWLKEEINSFSQEISVQKDGRDIKDVWGWYFFLIPILHILGVVSIIVKRPTIFEDIYLKSQ